jgi:MOSC domain-containing protein YiiM
MGSKIHPIHHRLTHRLWRGCTVAGMRLLSVNVGKPRDNPWMAADLTGIDKQPVDGPAMVTAPGPRGTGEVGLAGDRVFNTRHHGGPDQAVYAYAREDLDTWESALKRPLHNGVFGENLTTSGVDVNAALIGERWHVGENVILEVSGFRVPCGTFQGWLEETGWITRFTQAARPGAYFRIIEEGRICAGDPIEVVSRPDHEVTVALAFRALTSEPDLLPRLLAAEALPEDIKAMVRRRLRTTGPASRTTYRLTQST